MDEDSAHRRRKSQAPSTLQHLDERLAESRRGWRHLDTGGLHRRDFGLSVAFAAGAMDDLKPGAGIIVFATGKDSDGRYEASRIVVGRDGVKPPM